MSNGISLYVFTGLGAYFGIATLLMFASPKMSVAEFYGRLLISLAALLVCATYGVIASIVLRVVGYSGLSQWTVARSFKWTMRYTAGVRFIVQGEEHLSTRPAVLIGNHQTELDVLMLGTIFPPYCSVTSKKSLKWVPFLGWFMALSRTVFIDRGNRESAIAAFDGAAKQMRRYRQSVYIFPEGTRSYFSEPKMLPFKKGAFHLAVQAQVPIVPVVVANYSNILSFKRKVFTSGDVPVKVLPPIETKGMTAADVDGLTQRTRDAMMKELVTLSEIASGQGVGKAASATATATATPMAVSARGTAR